MAIRRELSEKLLRTTPLRVSLAAVTQREAERETFALEDAEGRRRRDAEIASVSASVAAAATAMAEVRAAEAEAALQTAEIRDQKRDVAYDDDSQ